MTINSKLSKLAAMTMVGAASLFAKPQEANAQSGTINYIRTDPIGIQPSLSLALGVERQRWSEEIVNPLDTTTRLNTKFRRPVFSAAVSNSTVMSDVMDVQVELGILKLGMGSVGIEEINQSQLQVSGTGMTFEEFQAYLQTLTPEEQIAILNANNGTFGTLQPPSQEQKEFTVNRRIPFYQAGIQFDAINRPQSKRFSGNGFVGFGGIFLQEKVSGFGKSIAYGQAGASLQYRITEGKKWDLVARTGVVYNALIGGENLSDIATSKQNYNKDYLQHQFRFTAGVACNFNGNSRQKSGYTRQKKPG